MNTDLLKQGPVISETFFMANFSIPSNESNKFSDSQTNSLTLLMLQMQSIMEENKKMVKEQKELRQVVVSLQVTNATHLEKINSQAEKINSQAEKVEILTRENFDQKKAWRIWS